MANGNIDKYIVRRLNDMRLNGVLCDLELVADDGTCALVHSPVWIAAFEDPTCLQELGREYVLSSKQLDIYGVKGCALKMVVEFIYGNEIEPTDELTHALEKLGMKSWTKFLVVSKMHNWPKTGNKNQRTESAGPITEHKTKKNQTACVPNVTISADRDNSTNTTCVTVKVENECDPLESMYTISRNGKRKSNIVEETKEKYSRPDKFEIDLTRVKSEPMSPGESSPQIEIDYPGIVKTYPSPTRASTATPEEVTSAGQNRFALPILQNTVSNTQIVTLENSGAAAVYPTSPVFININNCANVQNGSSGFQSTGIKQPVIMRNKRQSHERNSGKQGSVPYNWKNLLPKSISTPSEKMKPTICGTPPSDLHVKEQNDLIKTANGNMQDPQGKDDHAHGPEPVGLFINTSNLGCLQSISPLTNIKNLIQRTDAETASTSTAQTSSPLVLSTSSPNVNVVSTPGIQTPVTVTSSLSQGQSSFSNTSHMVQNTFSPFTLPAGAFPQMQVLGTNQGVIGNVGSTFLSPIGMPVGSPVVQPITYTNSMTPGSIIGNYGCQLLQNSITGPQITPVGGTTNAVSRNTNTVQTAGGMNSLTPGSIIGNYGCQLLQNSITGTGPQITPVGRTTSAVSRNTNMVQTAGGMNSLNNTNLGPLLVVNSMGNPQTLQYRFVVPPQKGSVSSVNCPSVLPNTQFITSNNTITNTGTKTHNVVGTSPSTTRFLSVNLPQVITSTVTSGMAITTTSSSQASTACISTTTARQPKATSSQFKKSKSQGKLDTKLHSDKQSTVHKERIKVQKAASFSGAPDLLKVSPDASCKESKSSFGGTMQNKDCDDPLVIHLDDGDDREDIPREISVAKNTIRNMKLVYVDTYKRDVTEKKAAQDYPVATAAMHAPPLDQSVSIDPSAAPNQTKRDKPSNKESRKKIIMIGRKEVASRNAGIIRKECIQNANPAQSGRKNDAKDFQIVGSVLPPEFIRKRGRGRPAKTNSDSVLLDRPDKIPHITKFTEVHYNKDGSVKMQVTQKNAKDNSGLWAKFRSIAPKVTPPAGNMLATNVNFLE